jgi:hypothetical protein
MFTRITGFKDLLDPDPSLIPLVINIEKILYLERRDDWRWGARSPYRGEPVLIIWFSTTRGEINRDAETSRFTPHRLYIVGAEAIDQFESQIMNY